MDALKYLNGVGIISFIIAVFDKERIAHADNKAKYFNEFLVKFYAAYRANNDFSMVDFFKCNYCDIYIPPYVYYLFESGEYDKLRRVLIVDYYMAFPNEKNSIVHTFSKFVSFIDIIYYFIVVFGLIGSMFLISVVFVQALILKEQIDYFNLGVIGISIIIWAAIVLKMKKYFKSNDNYSYNKNIIDKIIKSKIKNYKNISEELYFIKE